MTATEIVVKAWRAAGAAQALPASLDNGKLRVTFAADARFGVKLSSLTHLENRTGSQVGGFTWRAAESSDDGEVSTALWSLRTQARRAFSSAWGSAFGTRSEDVLPHASVIVTRTQDDVGRPALLFRWPDVSITGGRVEVLAWCCLGADDTRARWGIHVRRSSGSEAGIEWIEWPRIAIAGPVADNGSGPRASQAGAQVLLPSTSTPQAGFECLPMTELERLELETSSPTGEDGAPIQPVQFEAIGCVDSRDATSVGRVVVLATEDKSGRLKRTLRSVRAAGGGLVFDWRHRWLPEWSTVPVLGPSSSSSRYGGEFCSPYLVTTGCLEAEPFDWIGASSRYYRSAMFATAPPAVRRVADLARGDLARDSAWCTTVERSVNLEGPQVAQAARDWSSELAAALRSKVLVAQLEALERSEPAENALDTSTWRGTNFLPMPSMSHSLPLAWLPLVDDGAGRPDKTKGGFFYRPHLQLELDQHASVGFNVLRVWGDWGAWCADRAGYLESLRVLCAEMNARGLGMTYILWNGVPAGHGVNASMRQLLVAANYDPSSLRSLLWTLADTWNSPGGGAPPGMPSGELDTSHPPTPLNATEWIVSGRFGEWTDRRSQELVALYVRDVCTFLRQNADAAQCVKSIDLCNEANVLMSDATGRENVLDWLAQTWHLVKSVHPAIPCTVGWAGGGNAQGATNNRHAQLAAKGVRLSYLSMHHYSAGTDEGFAILRTLIDACKAEAAAAVGPAAAPLQVVVSECIVMPQDGGQVHRYLEEFQRQGIGAQVWCYIANNARRILAGYAGPQDFDGIVACETPALEILTSDVGRSWSKAFSSAFGGPALRFVFLDSTDPADDAALRAWVSS